jgi:hypothetical protein
MVVQLHGFFNKLIIYRGFHGQEVQKILMLETRLRKSYLVSLYLTYLKTAIYNHSK